jgi:hypothetical protein
MIKNVKFSNLFYVVVVYTQWRDIVGVVIVKTAISHITPPPIADVVGAGVVASSCDDD